MSMQQILNSKERKNAFFKFLAFFLVTVSLVVIAVSFNSRLPLQQNKKLQEEKVMQNIQDENQDAFVEAMNGALGLLDSLDKDKVNQDQVAIQIDLRVKDMETLRQRDASAYGRMNQVIIEKLTELKEYKRKIKSAEADRAKIDDLQNELARVKNELIAKEGQLDILRGQN